MKSMNRKKGKKIAVIAAVMVGFMVFAFMPAASATVTSFAVTPSTGLAGAVDSYNVLVTTTGVNTLNISIPAGFIAVAPTTGGVEIARVDFWNSSTKAYYGYGTVTASNDYPTEEVEVYCKMQVGGDEVIFTRTEDVDYTAGETTSLLVEYPEVDPLGRAPIGTATVNITLPTATEDGSINITIDCWSLDLLDDVHIAIKQFIKNPIATGDYVFSADGVDETVSITAPGGRAAVFRSGWWYFDTTGDHLCNLLFAYGTAGDTPLTGDIDQDESMIDDVIVFKDGYWLVDTDQSRTPNYGFWYGKPTDIPLVGDINQDGDVDTILVRDGYWFVDTDQSHTPNEGFWYGKPTDIPLVGDINQDGDADTILVRDGYWFVDTDYDHTPNYGFWYGTPTDIPLVGCVNQDGDADTIVVRDGYWFVDTDQSHTPNEGFWYGKPTDIPLVGDIEPVAGPE